MNYEWFLFFHSYSWFMFSLDNYSLNSMQNNISFLELHCCLFKACNHCKNNNNLKKSTRSSCETTTKYFQLSGSYLGPTVLSILVINGRVQCFSKTQNVNTCVLFSERWTTLSNGRALESKEANDSFRTRHETQSDLQWSHSTACVSCRCWNEFLIPVLYFK